MSRTQSLSNMGSAPPSSTRSLRPTCRCCRRCGSSTVSPLSCSRLSEAGTPVDFGLDRDLIEAVKRGRVEIVHAFLEKGASPNARDDKGGAALHWAAARGEPKVAELLVARGADIDARDGSGRIPREVAEIRGKAEVAALLGNLGAP